MTTVSPCSLLCMWIFTTLAMLLANTIFGAFWPVYMYAVSVFSLIFNTFTCRLSLSPRGPCST